MVIWNWSTITSWFGNTDLSMAKKEKLVSLKTQNSLLQSP